MELPEAVAEVRDHIEIAYAPGVGWADAKFWFVEPILRALEWRGPERILLNRNIGDSQKRIDFSLLEPGSAVVAYVDAVRPTEDLDTHIARVFRQLIMGPANLAVFTDGAKWRFHLTRQGDDPKSSCFAQLDIRANKAEIVKVFSEHLNYGEVIGGTARWQRMLNPAYELPRAWRRLASEPEPLLVELLQDAVEKVLSAKPTEEETANFLQGLIDGSEPSRTIQQAAAEMTKVKDSSVPIDPEQKEEPIRCYPPKGASVRAAGYRLFDEYFETQPWKGIWMHVVEEMYVRHQEGFITRVSRSPLMHGTSRTYITSSEYDHTAPKPISDSDYWAESNFNSDECIRRAKDLLVVFGYSRDELEVFR